MKTIYLACADYDYEGFSVMRAYEVETDANAFLAECKVHAAKEPEFPGVGGTAWHAALSAWRVAAPEGFISGDGYSVIETELR